MALLADLEVPAPPPGTALDAARGAVDALPDRLATPSSLDRQDRDLAAERLEWLTGVPRPCPRDPASALPGQPWQLGMQLAGWTDALRRLQPFLPPGDDATRVETLLSAFDAYGDAAWIGRAP